MSTAYPERDDPRFRITPFQQMASSCTGALCTSLLVTPLDVVKIRLQAQQKALLSNKCFLYCNGLMDHLCPCVTSPGGPTNWYHRNGQFNGTIDAFVKISRAEGVYSLWSGLGPTLVLAVPATVLYFVAYEQIRTRAKDMHSKRIGRTEQPFWIPLLAGASARVLSASVVSPLELIRTKMQSKKLTYLELGSTLHSHIQVHGIVPGLWKGLGSTLLRDVPFSGIYWLNYEGLKTLFSQQSPTFGFSFAAGAVAGAVAAVCTTPFDVVKTHQQIEMGEKQLYADLETGSKQISGDKSMQEKATRSKTTFGILRQIWQQNGVSGLFTGVVPRVAKVAPACAIMVATFEYGKGFFESYNAEKYFNNQRLSLE
ncbi:solute carrier family 25 member 40-like [Thrips palmi]|uniref:Solute carrier family 25 member 40-like n=1 Tax=Thrips palmi TaxID=161013 RepID=A0A6P8ZRB3_THRPL|nr:solute carrier family 25 member 40-like [Thrips palmi]